MIIHYDKEKAERKKQLALKEMLWSFYHAGVEYGKLNKQEQGKTNDK